MITIDPFAIDAIPGWLAIAAAIIFFVASKLHDRFSKNNLPQIMTQDRESEESRTAISEVQLNPDQIEELKVAMQRQGPYVAKSGPSVPWGIRGGMTKHPKAARRTAKSFAKSIVTKS